MYKKKVRGLGVQVGDFSFFLPREEMFARETIGNIVRGNVSVKGRKIFLPQPFTVLQPTIRHPAEEAIQCFKNGYEDMKNYYAEEGKEFVEVEFEYEYDMASFLSYFSKAFSLAGLSRITGINQGQLSHYVTGHRIPSARTKEKMQESIHSFAKDLAEVNFI